MSAVIRSPTRRRQPYVHKLRLEARDGATVQIQPAAPIIDAGPRILGKLVGVLLAALVLLLLAGEMVL